MQNLQDLLIWAEVTVMVMMIVMVMVMVMMMAMAMVVMMVMVMIWHASPRLGGLHNPPQHEHRYCLSGYTEAPLELAFCARCHQRAPPGNQISAEEVGVLHDPHKTGPGTSAPFRGTCPPAPLEP